MRTSRTTIVLAFILASLAPSLTSGGRSADRVRRHPRQRCRASGSSRPFRLDPIAPWLRRHLGCPGSWDDARARWSIRSGTRWPHGSWIESATGVEHWRGARFEGPLDLDDSRVIGWLSMLWSTDVHTLSGASASVHAVSVRLDADGWFLGRHPQRHRRSRDGYVPDRRLAGRHRSIRGRHAHRRHPVPRAGKRVACRRPGGHGRPAAGHGARALSANCKGGAQMGLAYARRHHRRSPRRMDRSEGSMSRSLTSRARGQALFAAVARISVLGG